LKERPVEIAKAVRRFPWMVDVVKQRPMSILHLYMVEVYVTRDRSETCIPPTSSKAFYAQNGAAEEVRLELECAPPQRPDAVRRFKKSVT
jgi:hypothetical protein